MQELPARDLEQAQSGQHDKCRTEPAVDALGVQRHAQKLQLGPQRGIELQVVNHFDHGAGAQQQDQRGDRQRQVADPQLPELAIQRHAQVHHDQAGNAAGGVHDHEHENQAQVKQPGLGELGQQHKGQHHQDSANDGPEKEGGPAQEGEQQVGPRPRGPDHFRGDDLEIERRQPARDAGKKAGNDEGDVAHLLGVVTHKLHAFRVVAHGIEHAAQRGAREGEHGRDRDEGVGGDQVIHLDLRTEGDAQPGSAGHPVA